MIVFTLNYDEALDMADLKTKTFLTQLLYIHCTCMQIVY